MGVAFLALSSTRGYVVVKTLREDLGQRPEYREKFRREVLAASSTRSSFTAQVLASDLDAERQWVAIEFVEGPTLSVLISETGPLAGPHQIAMALGLAEGLSQLHALRLVHRDLKPANVICAPDGPKLIDFGISEFEHDDLLTVPELGQMGSPGWIAPERISSTTRPTAAEDVYGWGCLCWYAATGVAPPHTGAITLDSTKLPAVQSTLAPLIQAATSRDPAERPTAASIVSALTAADPAAPTAALVTEQWHAAGSPTLALTQALTSAVRYTEPVSSTTTAASLPVKHSRWRRSAWLVPVAATIAFAVGAGLFTPLRFIKTRCPNGLCR